MKGEREASLVHERGSFSGAAHLLGKQVGRLFFLLGVSVTDRLVESRWLFHSRLLGRPRASRAVLLVGNVSERCSADGCGGHYFHWRLTEINRGWLRGKKDCWPLEET